MLPDMLLKDEKEYEELVTIWKEEFGKTITLDEAKEKGDRLILLMQILMEKPPEGATNVRPRALF